MIDQQFVMNMIFTGGALHASQAEQRNTMEKELVSKIAAKEAPESWSWVDQVSDDGNSDNDDDNVDADDRVESPPSRTKDHAEAVLTLPPWQPLTRACGVPLACSRTTCPSSI